METPISSAGGNSTPMSASAAATVFDAWGTFEWLVAFTLLVAIGAVCVLVWLTVARRPTRSQRLDGNEQVRQWVVLWMSFREYFKDHRVIFVTLASLSLVFYAIYATLVLFHPKPSHLWTLEDFFLALFAALGSALIILIMTDFAAKHFITRTIQKHRDEIVENIALNSIRVESSLFHQHQLCEVYRTTGLFAAPRVREYGPSFKDLFGTRHAKCTNVRVISSSGKNWLRYDDNWANRDDPLPLLAPKCVNVQVLIYSPLLHFGVLCEELQVAEKVRGQRCFGWLSRHEIPLSADSGLKMLETHLTFATEVIPRLRNAAFKLEVKVTGCLLPCSFFIVDDSSVYATFPMKTRQHDNAIAVGAYTDSVEFDRTKVVASFGAEFETFWDGAIPFGSYFEAHEATIKSVLSQNLGRK